MKNLIWLFVLNTNYLVAQKVITTQFGDTATVFRLSEKEIERMKKDRHQAYPFVLSLYKTLDKAYSIVVADSFKREAFPDLDLQSIFLMGNFSSEPYRSEIKLYKNYVENKKLEIKRYEDSLYKARRELAVRIENEKRDSIRKSNIIEVEPKKIEGDKINFIGGKHNNLILFTGYNINETFLFLSYLQNVLMYQAQDHKAINKFNELTLTYEMGSIGKKPVPLVVKFSADPKSKEDFIVDKVTITGDWEEVVKIFIEYWDNVPMKIDEVQLFKPIKKHSFTDLVEFSTEQNYKGKIIVSKHK